MIEEVYFLASSQYGLRINHAHLLDIIKHGNHVKQKGQNHNSEVKSWTNRTGLKTDLGNWLG